MGQALGAHRGDIEAALKEYEGDEAQEMTPMVLSELRLLASARFDSEALLCVVLSGADPNPADDEFQQRYGIQRYRYYCAIDERAARHRSMPTRQLPLKNPPF